MAAAKATGARVPTKVAPPKRAAAAKKTTAPAKKAIAAKKTAAPAKKAAAPAKKAVAKKAVAKPAAAAKKTSTAKKTAPPAKKAVAKKAVAKPAAAAKKTSTAKKTAPPAKKAVAKKANGPATTSVAKKTTVAKKTGAATKKTAVAPKSATSASKKALTPEKAAPPKLSRPRKTTVTPKAPTVTVQNVAAAVVTDPDGPETRWRGRPIAGNAVRALAVSVPLASSIVGGVVLSHLIHRPHGGLAIVGWWLAIMAMSTVILVAVDRVARRMLPLATLLKLSMAFPDQAPSRFKVAARAGTTRSLEQQLRRAEEEGIEDGPAQAARRILMLVGALGAHDRRTRGHSERVRAFNDLIAAEMRLPQSDRDRLRWAALLHDIGKLHVPTRILNKPKKPTEKEWAILKSHPARGARIASPLAGWLGEWAPTIEQHHERWDGAGYPNGLAGNDICLGARIVAVADAYEVMTAPRPYSRPVSAAAAREELARCADSQFDPEIVRAFLNISIGKLRKVVGPISWLAQLPLVGATPRLEAAVGLAGRQAVSVAATATGTGVLAAAMLPQAATPGHHHHHHPHITRLSTVDSSAGQAPAASAGVDNSQRKAPSPTATDAPRASGKAHEQAAAGPASHPDGVASAGSGASTGTSGSTTSSRSDSGQAPAARPTTPSGGGQSAAPAPTSGSSGSGSSGGTSGGSHDPQPAPAPDQSSSPSDSGGSSGSGSNDPAPAPSPSQTSTGDPQPSHGNDGGHGHQ